MYKINQEGKVGIYFLVTIIGILWIYGIFHTFDKHQKLDGLDTIYFPPYAIYMAFESLKHTDNASFDSVNEEEIKLVVQEWGDEYCQPKLKFCITIPKGWDGGETPDGLVIKPAGLNTKSMSNDSLMMIIQSNIGYNNTENNLENFNDNVDDFLNKLKNTLPPNVHLESYMCSYGKGWPSKCFTMTYYTGTGFLVSGKVFLIKNNYGVVAITAVGSYQKISENSKLIDSVMNSYFVQVE
jgi:hypothetical protein